MGDALVGADGTRRFGFLTARPEAVNPLDSFSGTARRLKSLRLKEWVGFTLIHPELASSMIIQDAHYLASSELYVGELGSGRLTQHARNAAGGSTGLPATLFGSSCSFRKPGYALEYTFAEAGGTHRIEIDVAGSAGAAAIRASLELHDAGTSPPLSVSVRLSGGLSSRRSGVAMYTHKVLWPVSGTLTVGEAEYVFDPARDLAILDEHHSFFPYFTRWSWATLAEATPDGPVGANLCARRQPPGEPEESCLWTPGSIEPLSKITFSAGGGWRITSADGRVDLRFAPEGRKTVKHQLGLAAIDYVQLYGRYSGVLARSSDGSRQVDGVRGVWEEMVTRF